MKRRAEFAFWSGLYLTCGVALAQNAVPAPASPAAAAGADSVNAAAPPSPTESQPSGKTAPAGKTAIPQTTTPDRTSLEAAKAQLTELPSAEKLRPSGPVTITANRAEVSQGNAAVYVGNVQLSSDTLKLDGDRMELKRFADGQYQAKVTGAPAHMAHPGGGPDDPPMSAQAKTLDYDSRSGIVDLVGEAEVTKGGQKIAADTIHYNVIERRIEASGGDGGQVKIVIPPAPPGAPSAGGSSTSPAPETTSPTGTAPNPPPAPPPSQAPSPKANPAP